MDGGRRHLEMALEIGFGGCAAMHLGVGVDEGQILPLLLRERRCWRQGGRAQDSSALKSCLRPMLGFKSLWSAMTIIVRIETMHMIGMGQLGCPEGQTMSAVQQFYSV